MAFKRASQKFNAAINTVTIGAGDKALTLGGASTLPFYRFDAPAAIPARVGVEILDTGLENECAGVRAFYEGCNTVPEMAARACTMEGADFICIRLESADPGAQNTSVEDCVALCKAVAAVVTKPLAVAGCKNAEKDTELFSAIADALQGENVLFLSAKEEDYKTMSASVGLAYGHTIGAESACDINLAKQLNVLINQMGVKNTQTVANLGTAAAGYGFEYVSSTMDRVRTAALAQNDAMLQTPVVTPVASEAWSVKEAILSENDAPDWGPAEQRGIQMEIATATAVLASGSDAVILKHPTSVATIAKLIQSLA